MTEIIDIHKVKGKRPEFDIYIGRRVPFTEFDEDSIWGNPFLIKKYGLKDSLWMYEKYIRKQIERHPIMFDLNKLKGKKLGCWCITTKNMHPIICHGQILLKIMKERGII